MSGALQVSGRSYGLIYWWLDELQAGNPIAVILLFLAVAFAVVAFIFCRYCAIRFGDYQHPM